MHPIILRRNTKLSIDNRTFIIMGIWYLGNTPTRYELHEVENNKNIGELIIKPCGLIDDLVEIGKIKII